MDLQAMSWAPTARFLESEEEWNVYRPLITRLYQTENKSLKEVMDILESRRGLKATQKMYKTRIKAWGLDKKNKRHEIEAILRKKARRDAVGKASIFTLRGRPIDLGDVERYRKRNGITVAELSSLAAASPQTPADLICVTPPPVQSPLLAPESIRRIDDFLRHVNELIEMNSACNRPGSFDGNEFFNLVKTGLNASDGAQVGLAGIYWRRAFRKVEELIVSSRGESVVFVMRSIVELNSGGRPEIAVMLRQQISWMARIGLPRSHPSYLTFTALSSWESNDDMEELWARTYRCILQKFVRIYGKSSPTVFDWKISHARWMSQLDPSASTEICDSGVQPEKWDRQTFRAMMYRHYVLHLQRQFEQAEEVALQVLTYSSTIKNKSNRLRYMTRSLYYLGSEQYRLKKYEHAEVNFIQTLNTDQEYQKLSRQRLLPYIFVARIYRYLERLAKARSDKNAAAEWRLLLDREIQALETLDEMDTDAISAKLVLVSS